VSTHCTWLGEELVQISEGRVRKDIDAQSHPTRIEHMITNLDALFVSHYTGDRVSIPLDGPLRDGTGSHDRGN